MRASDCGVDTVMPTSKSILTLRQTGTIVSILSTIGKYSAVLTNGYHWRVQQHTPAGVVNEFNTKFFQPSHVVFGSGLQGP